MMQSGHFIGEKTTIVITTLWRSRFSSNSLKVLSHPARHVRHGARYSLRRRAFTPEELPWTRIASHCDDAGSSV